MCVCGDLASLISWRWNHVHSTYDFKAPSYPPVWSPQFSLWVLQGLLTSSAALWWRSARSRSDLWLGRWRTKRTKQGPSEAPGHDPPRWSLGNRKQDTQVVNKTVCISIGPHHLLGGSWVASLTHTSQIFTPQYQPLGLICSWNLLWDPKQDISHSILATRPCPVSMGWV